MNPMVKSEKITNYKQIQVTSFPKTSLNVLRFSTEFGGCVEKMGVRGGRG